MITRDMKVLQISLCPEGNDVFDVQAKRFSEEILELSRGLYKYRIVNRHDVNASMFTNDQILQEISIEPEVNNRELDEVWVFGGPWSETSMGGRDPFWFGSTGAPLKNTGYRRFPLMRFGPDPLYTFARRVEDVMYQVYSGYPTAYNAWEHYIRDDRSNPNASCGSPVYPPNGILGGYNVNKEIISDCDDWEHFPYLRGRVRHINCMEWGGTMHGYIRWWLSHLPHGNHKSNGVHENWWHYVMNLDLVK